MTTLPIAPTFRVFAAPATWRPAQALERAVACVLFLFALPILSVAASVVWALSGRPPFIAHRRLGFGGSVLWVLKLRTMWTGRVRAPFQLVERLKTSPAKIRKTQSDPRVTSRFAAFCRRYSDRRTAAASTGRARRVGIGRPAPHHPHRIRRSLRRGSTRDPVRHARRHRLVADQGTQPPELLPAPPPRSVSRSQALAVPLLLHPLANSASRTHRPRRLVIRSSRPRPPRGSLSTSQRLRYACRRPVPPPPPPRAPLPRAGRSSRAASPASNAA